MKIKFCDRLRELRGATSQVDFACSIGAKQTTYSSWERGVKEPSIDVIVGLSRQFGVSVDWLFGLSDSRTGSLPASSNEKLAKELQEREAEILRLQAEIGGLRYALDAIGGRGAHGVFARHTARGLGA